VARPSSSRIKPPDSGLGHREREILAVLFRLRSASAATILDQLVDPPGYSTVRKMLSILESKGHVKHSMDGQRFIYEPVLTQDTAGARALRYVLGTFFGGSRDALVAALISEGELAEADLDELSAQIDAARRGRVR